MGLEARSQGDVSSHQIGSLCAFALTWNYSLHL